jgi:hypothetical protein
MTGIGSRYRDCKLSERIASDEEKPSKIDTRYRIRSIGWQMRSNCCFFDGLPMIPAYRLDHALAEIVKFRTMRPERKFTIRDLLHRATGSTRSVLNEIVQGMLRIFSTGLLLNDPWQALCSFPKPIE